jgi:hypothetical protein
VLSSFFLSIPGSDGDNSLNSRQRPFQALFPAEDVRHSRPRRGEAARKERVNVLAAVRAVPRGIGDPRDVGMTEEIEVGAALESRFFDPGWARPVVVMRVDDRREEVLVEDEKAARAEKRDIRRRDVRAGDLLDVGQSSGPPSSRQRCGPLPGPRPCRSGSRSRRRESSSRCTLRPSERCVRSARARRSSRPRSARRHFTRPSTARPRNTA